MGAKGPDNEPAPAGGLLGLFVRVVEFLESTERMLCVLAGLVLAVVFCLMPLNALGAGEPWFSWVGSGLIALAASVLLAWVFFRPASGHGSRDEDGA